MTHIVTFVGKSSIFMASDSRGNWHTEKEIGGELYQEIVDYADCIRKTFWLDKLNLGIQFIGIGFLEYGGEKVSLATMKDYFQAGIDEELDIKSKMEQVYLKVISLTKKGDTGNFVKGVISGMNNGKSYLSMFKTFTHDFDFGETKQGIFIDSEKNNIQGDLSNIEDEKIIQLINLG